MCSLNSWQAYLPLEHRWEQIFSLQFPFCDGVCGGVSVTLHQVLWQLCCNITGILWLQRFFNVPFFQREERILSSSIYSLCLAMTNVILAHWDILHWGPNLKEKEGENKVKVRPSGFLLMYKSPWIRFRNASGAPQNALYSLFKFIFSTALDELCQFWFAAKI